MLILRRVKHEADITDQAVAISRDDAVLGNTTGADRTILSHGLQVYRTGNAFDHGRPARDIFNMHTAAYAADCACGWKDLRIFIGAVACVDISHWPPLPNNCLSDLTGPIDNRRPVAAGTIERECAVLMAVLNLAVDMDRLGKNRLKRLPVPEYVKRERVLEGWRLLKLKAAASPHVWRLIMAALQIGLRENKFIETHEGWLMQRTDGGG